MIFRKFKKGDLKKIARPVELSLIPELVEDFAELAETGLAISVYENEKVICCGGLVPIDETAYEAWITIDSQMQKSPYEVAKKIRMGLDIFIESIANERIVAQIKDDFKKGKRLARFLGFKDTQNVEYFKGSVFRVYELER